MCFYAPPERDHRGYCCGSVIIMAFARLFNGSLSASTNHWSDPRKQELTFDCIIVGYTSWNLPKKNTSTTMIAAWATVPKLPNIQLCCWYRVQTCNNHSFKAKILTGVVVLVLLKTKIYTDRSGRNWQKSPYTDYRPTVFPFHSFYIFPSISFICKFVKIKKKHVYFRCT